MNHRGWLNAQQRQLPLQLLQLLQLLQQVMADICEHCQRAAVAIAAATYYHRCLCQGTATTTTTAAENVWASDLLP